MADVTHCELCDNDPRRCQCRFFPRSFTPYVPYTIKMHRLPDRGAPPPEPGYG